MPKLSIAARAWKRPPVLLPEDLPSAVASRSSHLPLRLVNAVKAQTKWGHWTGRRVPGG